MPNNKIIQGIKNGTPTNRKPNRKYYYVHLFFIYTKKKIDEIIGKVEQSQKPTESEDLSPKKVEIEKKVETKPKPLTPNKPTVFDKWLEYCDRNRVKYGKNNIKYWEKKLDIGYVNKKYIYQFKNIKITTNAPPPELFNKYGYDKNEVKEAPIVSTVQDRIMGLINRF